MQEKTVMKFSGTHNGMKQVYLSNLFCHILRVLSDCSHNANTIILFRKLSRSFLLPIYCSFLHGLTALTSALRRFLILSWSNRDIFHK